MKTKLLSSVCLYFFILSSVKPNCEFCKECHGDGCETNRSCADGVCLYGCSIGYHGNYCSEKCPPGCTQCISVSECTICKENKYGSVCQHECPNCLQGMCSKDTGVCSSGCETSYGGHPCKRLFHVETDSTSDTGSLSGLFKEQGYLLPVIGGIVVVIIVIVVGIICKQRRAKKKVSLEGKLDEDGKLIQSNGYKTKYDIPDIEGFVDSLKKRLLSDPDIKCLTVPGEKLPLELLRNRSGNCSIPFMDPIAEDLEETDEEEELERESDRDKQVVFTIHPFEEDDDNSVYNDEHLVNVENDVQMNKSSCVPEIVINKCDEIYILQNGSNENGHVAITVDYMERVNETNSYVPDMYKEIPTNNDNSVGSNKLSTHLDSFLNAKSLSHSNRNSNEESLIIEKCLNNNNQCEELAVS